MYAIIMPLNKKGCQENILRQYGVGRVCYSIKVTKIFMGGVYGIHINITGCCFDRTYWHA